MFMEYTKEEWMELEEKPFPNEHAARLKDPKGYKRFRRENDKLGTGVDAIWGVKVKAGKEVVELQSIRFDRKKFTVDEAKKWLKDHDHKPIAFEPATGKSEENTGKEYKCFPFEYKVDEEKGIFTGYASVFGNKDSHGDIVEPGAFKKTIKEFKNRIKVLYQHMFTMPIGKPVHLEEDSKGLLTETKVSMTTLGKDVWTLIKDKVITELSIGYDVIKKTVEEDEDKTTRHLLELKLWEYSPVTWASNDMAGVTGTKSEQEMEDMLFKLNDFMLKEGRVLSNKNMKLVKNAVEALQALLLATEPAKSTPGVNNEPPVREDSKDDDRLVSEIIGPLNDVIGDIKGSQLVDELKSFGESLRKGD